MKVIVISHTYITTLNRDKWKVFAQQHPEVSLTLVFPEQWQGNIFQHTASIDLTEATANYTPCPLPTHRNGNELLYRYHHTPLYTLIKTIKPHLIYVEQGLHALSFAQVNLYIKMLRLPTKTLFFTWVNWQPELSLKSKIFLSIIGLFNRFCSSGAIVGNNDAQEILKKNRFKQPIIVLPQLGINQHHFKPAQLAITHKKYIGYIGRITAEKGVFYLVRAFMALADMFPEWSLVFIGKGDILHQLHSYVASKQMLHRIEFCDPVPHDAIPTVLHKLSLLVLPSYDTPSWREQFGHVLIEAMACKIPVLGSTAGEIPHVIQDAGLIFQQRNQTDLQGQLSMFMHSQTLRDTLAQRGYERVIQEYTHDVIAQKTFSFWQKIMQN